MLRVSGGYGDGDLYFLLHFLVNLHKAAMVGENRRQLVTDEPVEFVKEPIEVQRRQKSYRSRQRNL